MLPLLRQQGILNGIHPWMAKDKKLRDTMSEKYWSRFPDTYDKKMEYVVGRDLRDKIIQELDRLPELGELVELGCGTGVFSQVIVPKTKNMFATDLSDSLLAVAKTRIGDHPKVKIQQENCMATSFQPEMFDSVFMANLIHVIESPKALLQECHRILKNNGTIVVVTFTGHGMKLWEKIKLSVRFFMTWGKPPVHTHSFTPENLASMMHDAGFTVKTSKVIGETQRPCTLLAKKFPNKSLENRRV